MKSVSHLPITPALKGHGFNRAATTLKDQGLSSRLRKNSFGVALCNRARLQSCGNRFKFNVGFSPC
jgi:hypothetical protein